MSDFLYELGIAGLDQSFDQLISRLAVARIDFYFYKLVIVERALKLGLNALSESLTANGDDGIEFVCDRAVLLKKSVVQDEALVK